ncbi:MAG TPA: MASE1 domain-containing protein [Verrucomicrobiae bacterium]|nr:MASE1 domain-containing protein [Verrucomicrobiae bacterium]
MAASERINRSRLVLNVVLVGILCYASNEIGFAHKIPPHNISVLWPMSAILFSALLVSSPRHWWAYVLAGYSSSIIRDAQAGFPAQAFLFIGAGLLEIVGAALVIRRYLSPIKMFDSLRELALYLAIAVIGAPMVSAFVSAFAGGTANYWFFWRVWYLSEALACLMLAPAILSWITLARHKSGTIPMARRVEGTVLVTILAGVCFFAFTGNVQTGHGIPALVYLPLPFLLWAAVRFGPLGVNTALLIVACLSISGAVHARGPFVYSDETKGVLSLQLFLATLSLPLMLLAAVIQESRARAQVLRESEARFRSMADTSPVMIWMSGPDQKSEYFNKRWLDFTGRTLEQELGEGWIEGVHPDDRPRCLRIYHESLDARKPFEMEYRLRHKDGHYRWVFGCGVPRFMPDGSFVGYIGSCLDIAERKDAELQLQEQRAEVTHLSRVAVVGELSGAVAHELNQPLTAILSNAQAAQRRLAQEPIDLDEIRDILTDIVNEDKRAGEIIRRLRALLKKGEMQLQPLSLNELANDTVMLAHGDFVSRGIVVSTKLAADLPVVRGDRVQLQQVLLNLISNACDAMRDNAPSERRLEIATHSNGSGTVEVAVTDEGPGIAPEARDRLFEPFVTTKKEGLGLGLTICRTIVKAHGGRLWSDNNPVRGAAFYVSLPTLVRDPI